MEGRIQGKLQIVSRVTALSAVQQPSQKAAVLSFGSEGIRPRRAKTRLEFVPNISEGIFHQRRSFPNLPFCFKTWRKKMEGIGALEVGGAWMSTMDESSKTRLRWDRTKIEEVGAAQKRLDELKALGYFAYKTTAKDDQGEVIEAIDAKAERIILHPGPIGG
jgi:hypothetical protein